MQKKSRNSTMDIIKGIACVAVVLIHYNWSNDFGQFIKTICRFAVPYFFFVSGYYLPDRDNRVTAQNLRRKILHIADMLWKAGLFYLVFCLWWNNAITKDWNLQEFIQQRVTPGSLIKLAVINDPLVYDHFWYMMALIYSYGAAYLIRHMKHDTSYLVLSVVLMLGFSALEEFTGLLPLKNAIPLNGGETTLKISNTFLFRALPFFMLGWYLRRKKPEITGKTLLVLLVAAAIIGSLIAVVEAKARGTFQFYLGTYVCVIALILITVCYPNLRMGALEFMGSKLSMNIYLYHIAAGKMSDLIAQEFRLWKNPVFIVTRPFFVLGTTALVAWLMYVIPMKWKARSAERNKAA